MGNEITISVDMLLWICGAIITIGGATAVISRWLAPYRSLKATVNDIKAEFNNLCDLKKQVADLRSDFDKFQRNQKSDHAEIETIETGIEKICKCMFALTDHELTGNSIERLRSAKDEMQEFLIEK